MMLSHALFVVLAQEAVPVAEAAPAPAPVMQAPPPPGAVYPPGYDPYLEGYLAGESQFAARLEQVTQEDRRAEFTKYVETEREKAVDRAEDYAKGEVDDDKKPISFAEFLDDKYRKRRNVGIGLFGAGFAPLGFGLYTRLSLGSEGEPALAAVVLGGGVIVAGAVVWGIFGARLGKYRRDRDAALGRPQARVHWRGVAPLLGPHTRGVGLLFAF